MPRPIRPKRAIMLVLLAVGGFWLGALLARNEAPPVQRAGHSVLWEDGQVVVRDRERVD